LWLLERGQPGGSRVVVGLKLGRLPGHLHLTLGRIGCGLCLLRLLLFGVEVSPAVDHGAE
jgi:hypothetical protein